jgi:light-regulated signal transduction histidine kinase (bacteriophytochrome)
MSEPTIEFNSENYTDILHGFGHGLLGSIRRISQFQTLLQRTTKNNSDEKSDELFVYLNKSTEECINRATAIHTLLSIKSKTPELEQVNLESELSAALSSQKRLHNITDSDITVSMPPLPSIKSDQKWISVILNALLSNAISYKSELPLKLDISVTPHKNHYEFSFTDNGMGIPMEQKETVFKLFKMLHPTTLEHSHIGAGLTICRAILDKLNSKIWIEPQEKGIAVKFIL